jgi:hypothetical protein
MVNGSRHAMANTTSSPRTLHEPAGRPATLAGGAAATVGALMLEPATVYTLRTAARPNRPLGFTSRTMMIMANATVSFSSVPMNFT